MRQFDKNYKNAIRPDPGDMANLFNIHSTVDDDGSTVDYFNINRTVYFNGIDNAAPSFFTPYTATANDTWTLISYKFYGTIEYWWLICKFNGVNDPTGFPVVGEVLKIPSEILRKDIVKHLKTE